MPTPSRMAQEQHRGLEDRGASEASAPMLSSQPVDNWCSWDGSTFSFFPEGGGNLFPNSRHYNPLQRGGFLLGGKVPASLCKIMPQVGKRSELCMGNEMLLKLQSCPGDINIQN